MVSRANPETLTLNPEGLEILAEGHSNCGFGLRGLAKPSTLKLSKGFKAVQQDKLYNFSIRVALVVRAWLWGI